VPENFQTVSPRTPMNKSKEKGQGCPEPRPSPISEIEGPSRWTANTASPSTSGKPSNAEPARGPRENVSECWVFNSEGVKHLIATLQEALYPVFIH
jgi:hypothetical protein